MDKALIQNTDDQGQVIQDIMVNKTSIQITQIDMALMQSDYYDDFIIYF